MNVSCCTFIQFVLEYGDIFVRKLKLAVFHCIDTQYGLRSIHMFIANAVAILNVRDDVD